MSVQALPLPTPYDFAEDTPGSIGESGACDVQFRLDQALLRRPWRIESLTSHTTGAKLATMTAVDRATTQQLSSTWQGSKDE